MYLGTRNVVDRTLQEGNTMPIYRQGEFVFDFDRVDDLTVNYIRHPMGILYDMRSEEPVQIGI